MQITAEMHLDSKASLLHMEEAHVCLACVKSNMVLRRVASPGHTGIGCSEFSWYGSWPVHGMPDSHLGLGAQISAHQAVYTPPPTMGLHLNALQLGILSYHCFGGCMFGVSTKGPKLCVSFISPMSPKSASGQVAHPLQAPSAQRHKEKDPHSAQTSEERLPSVTHCPQR